MILQESKVLREKAWNDKLNESLKMTENHVLTS